MKSATGLLVSALLLSGTASVAADMTLRWAELRPAIQGQKSTIVLTDGKRVKGTVVSIDEAGLTFDTNRSVKRETITQIRIQKNRTKGRAIGTSVGLALGGFGAAVSDVGSAGSRAAMVLVYAGSGYLIGHAIDRHEITINIIP